MQLDIYDVVRRPLVTERTMGTLERSNTYVFEVHPSANKVQIRTAVEKLFKVKVLSVNTVHMKGKKKRLGRTEGTRPDWKKAIVTLAPGEKLKGFEGI